MIFVVYSPIIVGYDRSEFRAAHGLGRQVQEMRLHDQLPRHRRSDRAKPNNQEERKPNAVLLIAASLIAAVRVNREEIKSSPLVHSKIADSIRLAEMIQARLRG